MNTSQTNYAGTVERLIHRLHDETIKAVALPPRDPREPGRQRKQLADVRLKGVVERIFRTQKLRIQAWLMLQQAVDRGIIKIPADWNQISDKEMADLVITLTEARQDGVRLFDEQVQTGIDYTATNARAARRAREYAGKLIKDIDKTTEGAVRNVIASFVETPGMTVGDVIEQLPFDEARSRMIAVTEITRAYAEGEMEAGQELKEKYPDVQVIKIWFTNEDEKVCLLCEPLGEMGEVDFDHQYFEPDDYSDGQNPPRHANCRCWTQTRTKI